METDRYGFTVPTKLSELEDDTHPHIIGSGFVLLTQPGPTGTLSFPLADTVITENDGFADPVGTNLSIVIPQTGLYHLSATFWWLSTTTSGGGVGRTTTPGTYRLVTEFVPTVQGVLDGSYLRDNKLGPLTTDPGDIAIYLSGSAIQALTAGDTIDPVAVGAALLSDVNAVVSFQVVRIA